MSNMPGIIFCTDKQPANRGPEVFVLTYGERNDDRYPIGVFTTIAGAYEAAMLHAKQSWPDVWAYIQERPHAHCWFWDTDDEEHHYEICCLALDKLTE